jgi:hypothetical protein
MVSRHEERVIRPFVGLEDFDELFNEITLTVNGVKATPNAFIPSETFKDLVFDLRTFWDPKAAIESIAILNLNPEDVHFAIYLLGKTLKRVEVLRDLPLSKLANPETSIAHTFSDAPHIFGDKVLGFNVVVALYLKNARIPKALTVYEEGTWLSKKEFTVRPERGLALFSPTPMNAEQKNLLGLPKKTLFYLDINESMFMATEVDQAFTFYVDEDVFIELSDERSKSSQAMALIMVRHALSGVVTALSKSLSGKNDLAAFDEEITQGEHDDTVGVRLLKAFRKKLPKMSNLDLLELAGSEPEKLMALLDDSMNLAGEILKVTKLEED